MIRDISIRAALNGFTVQCGCQQLVFETVDKLIDNLRDYLRDPDKHEKKFLSEAINRKHTHPTNQEWPAQPPGWPIPSPIYCGVQTPDTGCHTVAGGYTVGQTIQPTCGALPTEPCP